MDTVSGAGFESGHVLAAADVSSYADSVAEHGGWAAMQLRTPLNLLHTYNPASITNAAPDLISNPSSDMAQGTLENTGMLYAERVRQGQEQGRALLERLRDQLSARHGIVADIHQANGALLETLIVLEPYTRLLVIGKRGQDADFRKTRLGGNLERVVRALHCPVLVAAQTFRPIRRFLMAYDGSTTARRHVETICTGDLLKNTQCHLLTVGDANAKRRAHLDWAIRRLQQAGFDPRTAIIAGEPGVVIARQMETWDIDLLLMGAYGHSWLRNLIVGSTTTQLLLNCPRSVLLLR